MRNRVLQVNVVCIHVGQSVPCAWGWLVCAVLVCVWVRPLSLVSCMCGRQMMLCQAYWKAEKGATSAERAERAMQVAGHTVRTRLMPFAHVRVQRVRPVHAAAEARRVLAQLSHLE